MLRKLYKKWRHYNIAKKRKAVRTIEKYMMHFLYKQGGPLAPLCFAP